MFDKWASHQRFVVDGVARPRSESAPGSLAEFRELMRERRCGKLFLKPFHGSSGSGVCAIRWTKDREQLIAPIVVGRRSGRTLLSNSLRVKTYQSMSEIDAVVPMLAVFGSVGPLAYPGWNTGKH